MTTEELQKMNDLNTQSAALNTLEDEDEFLREMRQLAGMDDPAPAVPFGVANAGKATAPHSDDKTVKVSRDDQTVKATRPVNPQPGIPAQQPDRYSPEPYDEENESRVPGWVKGLLVLCGSAAILVLSVFTVLNGLHL